MNRFGILTLFLGGLLFFSGLLFFIRLLFCRIVRGKPFCFDLACFVFKLFKLFGFIYYSLSVIALYAFDEIFYRLIKKGKCNAKIYYIKGFLYFILATVGSIFFTLPVYLEVLYIVFGLLIIIESQFLDDVFNHEKGNIISVIYFVFKYSELLLLISDGISNKLINKNNSSFFNLTFFS